MMSASTKLKTIRVPPSAQRRARDRIRQTDCQLPEVSYNARIDLSGIVCDFGQNAPFEGEIVRHTASRTTTANRPKKGLYDSYTYVEGLLRTQASSVTEGLSLNESRRFIASCAQQFGNYNFISIDRYFQLLADPIAMATKLNDAQDPAKIAARQLLEQVAQPKGSLGRDNVGRNMHLLLLADGWLENRQAYLSGSVLPAAIMHLAWVDQLLRDHNQLVQTICTKLSTSDNFTDVWPYISPLISQLQIKPWTFFKHYFSFISRRDLAWTLESDINLRLINALVLEGAGSDLCETVRLAEYAQTAADRHLVVERLMSRIQWLETLELPHKYGGNVANRGLRQELITSLERLRHCLRIDNPSPNQRGSHDDRISARKLDGNRLRWELRYRALPGQLDCELWHGPIH